ncbi:MAG: hypothetical protein QGF99_02080 [Acidimicrobiales bacterium]|nr:hypothetical protein [Acidimicrobiales bacterium]
MVEIIGAHLVGSAPVDSPSELFSLVQRHLGHQLSRVPDGEVGERDSWIRWQYAKLAQCPQLVAESSDSTYTGRALQQFVLTEESSSLDLVELGYAAAALESWKAFQQAQNEGHIGPHQRFMVGLPSPLSVVTMYVTPEARPLVIEAWTSAMEAEVKQILDHVPPDSLAIQWEIVIEFGILEGLWSFLDSDLSGHDARSQIAERILHLGNLIPEPVELGFHLCYGDSGHQHFIEPENTGHLAWVATSILGGVQRPVQWIHLPVPRSRDDVAYFEPLGEVVVPDATELYLGLVHQTGGIEGSRNRIAAASQVVPRFGVATECGLGRRSPDDLAALLDQHAELISEAE